MLDQRRRRWANVRTTSSQCIVFAGIPSLVNPFTPAALKLDAILAGGITQAEPLCTVLQSRNVVAAYLKVTMQLPYFALYGSVVVVNPLSLVYCFVALYGSA